MVATPNWSTDIYIISDPEHELWLILSSLFKVLQEKRFPPNSDGQRLTTVDYMTGDLHRGFSPGC